MFHAHLNSWLQLFFTLQLLCLFVERGGFVPIFCSYLNSIKYLLFIASSYFNLCMVLVRIRLFVCVQTMLNFMPYISLKYTNTNYLSILYPSNEVLKIKMRISEIIEEEIYREDKSFGMCRWREWKRIVVICNETRQDTKLCYIVKCHGRQKTKLNAMQ